MTTLYDFSAASLDGTELPLAQWRGQVVLVVNVASHCGFTPQYSGLEALQQRFAGQGFSVLAFPCNQFGRQEPGDAAEIRSFCDTRYGVTFPMFAKIDVNGGDAHPLYRWLKEQKPGVLGTEAIKWNFTKFLVGRDGQVIARYAPTDAPGSLTEAIEQALAVPQT
ncbi:glutathione peroxidase [Bordetella holmesii]|uniref:glutathione peroxidase n=1 Tax=Bordetella holmesii TaxID=35814 RepID=UPI0012986261|nr:glutathione peroxidase [Bordetella holmesii]QGD80266.1 glutathione peroxidase [Bordetella holmesii]